LQIDASEYSEKHSISRLLGAPPGYVGHDSGGQLTEWVRRRPYSVILIDEIEKAAKEFYQLFLGILDDGRATDGQGRLVSFKNCIIICTSNLGAQFLNEDVSGDGGPVSPQAQEMVHSSIRAHFPPEFINRLDSIVIFRKLSRVDIRSIVEVRIKEIQHRMMANGKRMKLQLDEAAKDYLGSVGYHPQYGARPLGRALQSELLTPLSVLILRGQIRDGEVVKVEFNGPQNKLQIVPNHPIPEELADTEDIDMEDEDGFEQDGDAFIEPLD
jgi:ATP-dependent Clp protease ATP-binding subunit ClpB